MLKNAGIISLGGYIPAKRINPEELGPLVDYLRKGTKLQSWYTDEIAATCHLPGTVENNEDGWINQPWYQAWLDKLPPRRKDDPFNGTKERRRVPKDPDSVKNSLYPHPMLSSDAETLAGAIAIYNSGLAPEDIDMVLLHSLVPDRHVPLNASLVQAKLNLSNAAAFNIDTCCSSFVTMTEIAMTYVRMGLKSNVLVVCSALNSIINDRSTYYSPVPGDGAAAAVISSVGKGYGYIASHQISIGHRHKAIVFHKRKPELLAPTQQGPSYEQEFVTFYDMDLCKEIAVSAKEDMARVVLNALEKVNYKATDIDFIAMHQPTPWITKAWCEAIGVPVERSYESYKRYGNIACVSVPVNFIEGIENNLVRPGDNVMIASSGVGENHIALLHNVDPRLLENKRV